MKPPNSYVNLATYSNTFINPVWTPLNATLSASSEIFNGEPASKIVCDATAGSRFIGLTRPDGPHLADSNVCISCYFKSVGSDYAYMLITDGAGYNANLIVEFSTLTASARGHVSAWTNRAWGAEDAGDGWVRAWMKGTFTITPAICLAAGSVYVAHAQFWNIVADGTQGAYISDFQVDNSDEPGPLNRTTDRAGLVPYTAPVSAFTGIGTRRRLGT